MAEKEWAEDIMKELREIGLGIMEEVRCVGKEIRGELQELRAQVERMERRQADWTQSKESEGRTEERKREVDERGGQEREEERIEKIEKQRGGRKRNERQEEEREESSDEGWSDGGWEGDWWEEVASIEEGRSKEKRNSHKEEIRKEVKKGEVGFKNRTGWPEKEAERRPTSVKEAGGTEGKSEVREDKGRVQKEDKDKECIAEKNRLRRLVEEREEEIRRRERKEREEERKAEREKREKAEKRKRSLIWRRVSRKGPKERREIIETIMERVLGRIAPIRRTLEVMGADKKEVIFVELEEEEDKEDTIERSEEIWRRWEVGVDEELTMEERAYRHRLVEKAREERMKGRSAIATNKRLWIDGREVRWEEEGARWRRVQNE